MVQCKTIRGTKERSLPEQDGGRAHAEAYASRSPRARRAAPPARSRTSPERKGHLAREKQHKRKKGEKGTSLGEWTRGQRRSSARSTGSARPGSFSKYCTTLEERKERKMVKATKQDKEKERHTQRRAADGRRRVPLPCAAEEDSASGRT